MVWLRLPSGGLVNTAHVQGIEVLEETAAFLESGGERVYEVEVMGHRPIKHRRG